MLALQILIDGFAISALYALGATGFTLIFGVSGVLNLSHGAIMVLAAVAAWGAARVLHMATNANPVLPIVEGVVGLLGVRTPKNEIFTAVVCCLVIGLLWLLVNRTKTGKVVLAASMNPRGVTLLGFELTSIYVVVWGIYGILAGIAGVLLGMFLGVSSYSVGPLTASAFSIVVLGGLGSVSGSLIAAFVVGYLETITAYLISPAYRTIPPLLLLVAVMYISPQGLLGRR